MMRTPLRSFAVSIGLGALLAAMPAHAWEDRSTADMPWLGSGSRAHLYFDESACFGCPTGSRVQQRWGRSAYVGEDPYVTVGKAMSFLFGAGGMANAARSIGSGTIGTGSGTIDPKALPYHMTVVMVEPTVIVMNFDLGALIHVGELKQGPVVGTPYIDGYLTYGTRVPATGTLLWFSPDTKTAPTPVPGQAGGRGEINAGKARLSLERRNDEWVVTAK